MTNRLVVFSDVQGNSVALQAMFDYTKNLPDDDSLEYICLGDVACGYAPNTVLDLLRENDVRCIRGNMDDVILNPEVYTGDDESEKFYNGIDRWASARLTQINRDFLAKFFRNLHITGDRFYRFAHGTPDDNTVALDYDTPQHILQMYMIGSRILFTGHTHKPMMIQLGDNLLINPGSIGFPDTDLNGKRPLRAQFVIVDEGRFEFITVNYKREDFSFAVMNSGMPHAIWYLGLWDIA